VPSGDDLTFYVRHGDVGGPVSATIAGLTIAGMAGVNLFRRGRTKERRSPTAV